VPGLDPWGNGVLEQGVLNGTVTEARLDEQVIRALTPYFALGQDDADFPTTNLSRIVFAPNASDIAYQVAKEGITLVKNVGSGRGLPLVSPRSLGRESTDRDPASRYSPHPFITSSTSVWRRLGRSCRQPSLRGTRWPCQREAVGLSNVWRWCKSRSSPLDFDPS